MSEVGGLKFKELGVRERRLLLMALRVPTDRLQCYYCGKTVDYRTCGIMPPLERKESAKITCGDVLCICEYLSEYEDVIELMKKRAGDL